MQSPETDLSRRSIVWDAMHVLWLDTDVDAQYFDQTARICAGTDYTLSELEQIYWCEVYPVMRRNVWSVAGEWAPIDREQLSEMVMKHYAPRRRIRFKSLRTYAYAYWQRLAEAVTDLRADD